MRPRDSAAIAAICFVATVLAFDVLNLGRTLVVRHGTAIVRRDLVRESDRVANLPTAQLLHHTGCRAQGRGLSTYRTCVFLSSTADSVRVEVRLEPHNTLLAPDSAVFLIGMPTDDTSR
ncbi:MAG: hypothetical protein U0163_08335 [Gemmatimonadaceae bacterium]